MRVTYRPPRVKPWCCAIHTSLNCIYLLILPHELSARIGSAQVQVILRSNSGRVRRVADLHRMRPGGRARPMCPSNTGQPPGGQEQSGSDRQGKGERRDEDDGRHRGDREHEGDGRATCTQPGGTTGCVRRHDVVARRPRRRRERCLRAPRDDRRASSVRRSVWHEEPSVSTAGPVSVVRSAPVAPAATRTLRSGASPGREGG